MLKKEIKIGFISEVDPKDKKALSGTPYKMYDALQNSVGEVIWIPVERGIVYKMYQILLTLLARLTHRNVSPPHTAIGAFLMSKSLNKKLMDSVDVFFAPFASSALYAFKSKKPLIYLSDATFKIMVNYYPGFSHLFSFNVRQGMEVEKRALQKASIVIMPSEWAVQSVVKDYGIPMSKIHKIEFGANIEDDNSLLDKKDTGMLHLLFMGVDWQRKGGDIAVSACKKLNQQGIKSVLHIVGIPDLDPVIQQLPYIDNVGFLNKNDPAQYRLLVETIRHCDCLLLPTRAECTGIVFCESSAYGLPSFAYQTGGISDYVVDGRNGYLLPLNSTGDDFASKIAECYKNGALKRMSGTAREIYKERLNWGVWTSKMKEILGA